MAKKYIKQNKPFVVPTNDGKLIEEHFGNECFGTDISIAKMIAPPGWEEPFQTPEFDEYTYVIRGKKIVTIGNENIELKEGESIKVNKGTRVKYSNPFENECEYLAICNPSFSIELVHRES